jgi:hypothetical protein
VNGARGTKTSVFTKLTQSSRNLLHSRISRRTRFLERYKQSPLICTSIPLGHIGLSKHKTQTLKRPRGVPAAFRDEGRDLCWRGLVRDAAI